VSIVLLDALSSAALVFTSPPLVVASPSVDTPTPIVVPLFVVVVVVGPSFIVLFTSPLVVASPSVDTPIPIVVPLVVVEDVGPSFIVTVFVGTNGELPESDAGELGSLPVVTVGDEGCDCDDGEDPFALSTDSDDDDDDDGAAAGELGSVLMVVPPYLPPKICQYS
jgi:hypothetical protein